MPAQIPRSTLSIEAAGIAEPPPPPSPGLLEQAMASFRVTADESESVQRYRREQAYMPLFEALKDAGVSTDAMRGSRFSFNYGFGTIGGELFDYDRIWQEAGRHGIAGLPATQEEFEQQAYRRAGDRDQDQALLARGEGISSIASQFAGAMGGSFTDPVNIATLPIGGGGRTVAQRILSEALVGAATEAATTPQRITARSRMGEATSAGDVLFGVAAASAGAGAFRGAFEAAAPLGRSLTDMVTARLPDLPVPIRERWEARQLAKQEPLDDPVLLADLTEAIVGSERFSDLEQAAVTIARREGRQAQTNPFRTAGESTAMHEALAAEALQRIMNVAPLPGRRPVATAYQPIAVTPRPAPTLSGDAETRFMARVRQAESGGNDTARAATSSATGRYQFTDGTWLAYYKRRFGAGGLTDAQILSKRGDGNLQDTLMRDLTNDNSAALRSIGAQVTPGNLYLMHFAGKGGGGKVLRAAPDTPLAQVLGPRALAANSFLQGRTAGWLVDWAQAKMGGSSRAPQIDSRFGSADEVATAQAALDEATARADALADADRAARDGQQPIADALDTDAVAAPEPGDMPALPSGAMPDAMPDNGEQLVSALRAIVDTKGRSLNQVDRLARELDATPDQVRGALGQLATEGTITRNGRTGKFMRKPPGGPSGPDDMIRFVARNGGLSYDGLSANGRAGGSGGHDLRNTGHMDAFVPGVGPMLRPGGRGLDEMAELLWDAGYFGPPATTPRPRETELIELLNTSIRTRQRVYASGDGFGAEREATVDELEDIYGPAPDDVAPEPDEWGRTPDQVADDEARFAQVDEAWDNLDPADLAEFTARRLDELLDDAWSEAEDAAYDQAGYSTFTRSEAEAASRAAGDDGRAAEPANPLEGGAGAGDGGQGVPGGHAGPALDALGPEQRTPFLDPDAQAARLQADSLEHDARAAIDPNIAARERQQAQLGAQAPLRARTDQQSTTGFGLFGAADGVRLDEAGELRPMADLLNDFDAEAAELKALRDCL